MHNLTVKNDINWSLYSQPTDVQAIKGEEKMPLYYEQHGSSDNPTLVFLHGFLGNSLDWHTTIEQLKKTFIVYASIYLDMVTLWRLIFL